MMALCYVNPNTRWNTNILLDSLPWIKDTQPLVQKKPKYVVKFADVCRVVLVPKREEYIAAGIKLWWSASEFNQFKRERYLELALPTQTPSDNKLIDPQKSLTACYELNLRILVCSSHSSIKSPLLRHLSQFLWNENNLNRSSTSFTVTYTTPDKAQNHLNESPFYYNIVLLDKSHPSSQSHTPSHPGLTINCSQIRAVSSTVIIICVMESEAALQSNDDKSADQADLLLAAPQIPSVDNWRDIVSLLTDRLEASDYLPSPLIQHFITAL